MMYLLVLLFRVCCICVSVVFFFFKQKTAYEMRISDWSSDVCSSDLMYALHPGGITKRVLRDTFSEDYDKNGLRIQGKDADEGVITTECGIQVGAPQTMGILRNVLKAVKTAY